MLSNLQGLILVFGKKVVLLYWRNNCCDILSQYQLITLCYVKGVDKDMHHIAANRQSWVFFLMKCQRKLISSLFCLFFLD